MNPTGNKDRSSLEKDYRKIVGISDDFCEEKEFNVLTFFTDNTPTYVTDHTQPLPYERVSDHTTIINQSVLF